MHNVNLKKARTSEGYTQREMAEKLGIQPSSYQRYESGTRLPNLHTAFEIAKILNTSTTVLFNFSTSEMDVHQNNSSEVKN